MLTFIKTKINLEMFNIPLIHVCLCSQMNQIRVQLDNESRNLAAATDDNIHLKAQVEAFNSKNINLEAKVHNVS